MRVGIVCPYSLSLPGGVQGQVLGLGRALRALGHDARVLGPCDGPPPDASVMPLGNSIPTAANGSIAPLAPDPAAVLRTIRALRDEEFDVLHLHEPLAPGPTMTAVVFKPAPLVGTFHAAGSSLAYKWLMPVVRRLVTRLDVRVAVSQEAREMAEHALGGTYAVAFNGVEVDRIEAAERLKTESPTIFFLARHEPRKGLEVLLHAMASLPSTVRLWVGGDGPDTARLKSTVAGDPRIEWLGRLSDEEKFSRLRSATVFCAPSLRGESFGVVLLEAMAARTPIVASDLPGYAKVAHNGEQALLVPPSDAGALAHALATVIDDPVRAARLVDAGVHRAHEYSMAALADRYLEYYAAAVGASARG